MVDSHPKFLKQNTPTIGNWISIGHPAVAEICSREFDFVVGLEYTSIGLETLENMLRAVYDDVVPLVRVPASDPVWIKRVLDLEATGSMIPMIETREQAEQAVDAMQHSPDGE